MPTAKTAVIYARFSCNKQREASIDDQLRICRQWCQRERYAIVAEYCDYAISGRTDDRPEFQRMVANAGESDIVLVYMMDRFSRGEYDAPIYKRELAQHGVKLVSALEQIPDSPEGIIYEKLLEGLAACESKKTADPHEARYGGNALKCKTNGVRVFGLRQQRGRRVRDRRGRGRFRARGVQAAHSKGDHQLDSSRLRGTRGQDLAGKPVRLLDGRADGEEPEVHGALRVGRRCQRGRHARDHRRGDVHGGTGHTRGQGAQRGELGRLRPFWQGDLRGLPGATCKA